jgi:hypothetical protein
MPTFHFDRRRLRRTAWATLAVWLFALMAGVVNACVLTPSGSAERAVWQVSRVDMAMHDAHAGTRPDGKDGSRHDQGESVAHQGHGQDSGKVSCLKFCDDESSAIAKVKLPVIDLGSSLLIVVELWNTIAATSRVGVRQSLERPGSHGPPLVIRFLRLTL